MSRFGKGALVASGCRSGAGPPGHFGLTGGCAAGREIVPGQSNMLALPRKAVLCCGCLGTGGLCGVCPFKHCALQSTVVLPH